MGAQLHRIDIAATNSLDARGVRWVVAIAAVGCFVVALYWTLKGFWMTMPYAVLEVVALAWALQANRKRALLVQTILVSEAEIRVRKQDKSGTAQEWVFPTYWTRVRLRKSAIASHPAHLTFESGGKSCEIGEFLTEERRLDLAHELQGLVGGMGESPATRVVPPG